MEEKEYVERLEKIVDKQNDLLTHFDAKFQQQESLNETLSNQNKILREDIKKHKDLLLDMNKTVNQQKNVVKKLKEELEQQLKIQQDLHRDYGEVIKNLTEELEEATGDKNISNVKNDESKDSNDSSDKIELPPKDFETNHVSDAANMVKDIKDKSSDVINDYQTKKKSQEKSAANDGKCPKCGAEVKESFIFCDSCGEKLV